MKSIFFNRTRKWALLAPLAIAMTVGGCETLTVPDFNNPGIGDLTDDPSRTNIQLVAQGLMIGARAGISARAGYVSSLGILGRESYNFDPSDPRFLTGLLIGPLDGASNAFGGAHWVARYRNIRNANTLLDLIGESGSAFTDAEKEALRGYAKTIQAHDFLLAINTRDDLGAPIEVSGDATADPAPIVAKDAVLTNIDRLLNEAAGHLTAGGASFPFQLSSGFAGFDTPADFREFTRGLQARLNAYQQDWAGVITALGESFIDDSPSSVRDLDVGVYHSFSSAPGDVTNAIFDPSRLIIVTHPSIATDVQPGDDRLDRKVVSIPSVDDQAQAGVSTTLAYDIYDGLAAPIALIRNEELILLRAEANMQLGNDAAAAADIDVIRTESGQLSPIGAVAWAAMTATQQLDELLYNRRYSLMFEGHRWIDMRRYGRLADLPIDAGTSFVRFSRFPFPVRECDARVPPPSQGCSQEAGF